MKMAEQLEVPLQEETRKGLCQLREVRAESLLVEEERQLGKVNGQLKIFGLMKPKDDVKDG